MEVPDKDSALVGSRLEDDYAARAGYLKCLEEFLSCSDFRNERLSG